MSKRPDRLERVVKHVVMHMSLQSTRAAKARMLITLLRRERARLKRKVKGLIAERKSEIRCIDDGLCDRDLNRPAEVNIIQREIQALDDVLKLLEE